MSESRRILSDEEKRQVRALFKNVCYFCEQPLDGYTEEEIQYDHIYAFADGYGQDLSNFAPVHASRTKLNCHAEKGRDPPYEYKEKLRIRRQMERITGLKDLCPCAQPVSLEANYERRTIRFEGAILLPLYTQHLDGKDHWYFYHEVPIKFIENDDKIQLRPLEDKIYPLIANLRHSVQLLPSIARYDAEERKIKVFDGQHKAVAQIVGNGRQAIPCIVFLNTDFDALRVTVFEAHTTFLQQRYKRSHIADKLADIFAERIAAFRESIGNPNAPYTERDILRHDTRATVRQFILAQIIEEVRQANDFVDACVARDRKEQKGLDAKPMIWQSLELLVSTFCNLEAVDTPSDDPGNFREEEVENLSFLLNCIKDTMIKGKWNPTLPDSEQHKLSRNYFYDKAFTVWVKRLADALRFAYDQKVGRAVPGPLCYREPFSGDMRLRLLKLFQQLARHGVWMNPAAQRIIAGAYEKGVEGLFNNSGLDWVYLAKLD